MTIPVLVTGSSGKLGRVLRQVWVTEQRFQPLWQVRKEAGPGDLLWPIGSDWAGPSLKGGVILHLAGGRADLAGNVTLAEDVCRLADAQGAAHVILASSSAVYAPSDKDIDESVPPAPGSDYGQSKWAMEQALGHRDKTTFLRIANVFGCDGLISNARFDRKVSLTPVPGRDGGPMRCYIGPVNFGRVLGDVISLALQGKTLPKVLNFGLPSAVTMAELLDAAGFDWGYGAESADVLARLVLDVGRLGGLVDLPKADPAGMAEEWKALGMDRAAR